MQLHGRRKLIEILKLTKRLLLQYFLSEILRNCLSERDTVCANACVHMWYSSQQQYNTDWHYHAV